ncbi:hypothetical protein Q5P01_021812 [Channa striata]|uniref:Uncharacterized protein n=1 Tax=Channa striata TaxID=64152 RepID=A0AA88LVQ6_CHASR|nr:hypothetical protein Q5P01_021812 [Channa striata]
MEQDSDEDRVVVLEEFDEDEDGADNDGGDPDDADPMSREVWIRRVIGCEQPCYLALKQHGPVASAGTAGPPPPLGRDASVMEHRRTDGR